MKKFNDSIKNILISLGIFDIENYDFKTLDNISSKENLIFSKIRGSVRLMNRKVLLVKDTNKIVEDFISTPIH